MENQKINQNDHELVHLLENKALESNQIELVEQKKSLLKGKIERNRRNKPVNFATGVLIQKWCRHQYLKALIPTLIVLWYFGLAFLAIRYERHSVSYIDNQLPKYNCTKISEEYQPFQIVEDCTVIDRYTQYLTATPSGKFYKVTVNCTIPGADFYYPKADWGINDFTFYYEIIVNFLIPLLYTYFIYETLFLSLYDCLVLTPAFDYQTNKAFLRYSKGIFRVSWFCFRDLYNKCFPSHQVLHGRKQPGIRVGYFSCLWINVVAGLTAMTILSFGVSPTSLYRCLHQDQYVLDESEIVILIMAALFFSAVLIPTIRYYYRLLFFIKDVELLATEYSDEFLIRRHGGIRNLLDLIPLLMFPLWSNFFYYPLWLLPNVCFYLLYRVIEGIWRIISQQSIVIHVNEEGRKAEKSSHEVLSPWLENYFAKYVFDLDHRWWCTWFIREVEDSDCISLSELDVDDY